MTTGAHTESICAWKTRATVMLKLNKFRNIQMMQQSVVIEAPLTRYT